MEFTFGCSASVADFLSLPSRGCRRGVGALTPGRGVVREELGLRRILQRQTTGPSDQEPPGPTRAATHDYRVVQNHRLRDTSKPQRILWIGISLAPPAGRTSQLDEQRGVQAIGRGNPASPVVWRTVPGRLELARAGQRLLLAKQQCDQLSRTEPEHQTHARAETPIARQSGRIASH